MAPSPKKKPKVEEKPDIAKPAADSSRSDSPDTAEVVHAASGAQGDVAIESTAPVVSQDMMKWSTTALLEMQSVESQTSYIQQWTTATKSRVDTALMVFLQENQQDLSIQIPSSVMLIPPLAISTSAIGGNLGAFREVMNYDNFQVSFRRNTQYEAAGTIWMLDPSNTGVNDEGVTVSQLEAASWQWSGDALLQSSSNPDMRRYSFDIPLPARITQVETAQRKAPDSTDVLMSSPCH